MIVCRPYNRGRGIEIIDKGYCKIAVINLQGAVYLDPIENPFSVIDSLIDKAKSEGAGIIIIDFHAEATAEKKAMGFYVDGRVSAIFGTHTHTQTNDNQLLNGRLGSNAQNAVVRTCHTDIGNISRAIR